MLFAVTFTNRPISNIKTDKGEVVYLNSGDWIENLTALEYHNGHWKLYSYLEDQLTIDHKEDSKEETYVLEKAELFQSLLEEFRISGMTQQSK